MVADQFNRRLRDLRISVTDRCNFRCPYCMPAEIFGERYEFLPRDEILTFEEITRLATIFVDLGVTKIRLSGGEPLLRQDLPTLVAFLSAIDGIEDLALTTNGSLLAKLAMSNQNSRLISAIYIFILYYGKIIEIHFLGLFPERSAIVWIQGSNSTIFTNVPAFTST